MRFCSVLFGDMVGQVMDYLCDDAPMAWHQKVGRNYPNQGGDLEPVRFFPMGYLGIGDVRNVCNRAQVIALAPSGWKIPMTSRTNALSLSDPRLQRKSSLPLSSLTCQEMYFLNRFARVDPC